MTIRTHKRDVSLVKVIDPKFLSLVKSPANKTGFKVIRGDDGHTMKIRQRFLSKRTSQSSLLAITLPSGISENEATELMKFFNLGDDYSIFATEDGDYVLRRADAENAEFPRQIEMGNGFTALVESKAITRHDSTVTGVTLAGIHFEGRTAEESLAWLEEHDIEAPDSCITENDGIISVQRTGKYDKQSSRTVTLDEGVMGIVVRSKETDVPLKVYRSVLEESYGNWGWGQLDFAAALAGPEFEDKSWDAIRVLRNILEQIILYSELPLDDRKTLVENACEQFASYIGGLLDTLPKGLIEKAISRNDETVNQEAVDMAKTIESVQRSDEENVEENATAVAVQGGEDTTTEYVTRDDITAIVNEAVTTAVAAAMGEHVTRSDDTDNKVVDAVTALGKAVDAINSNVEAVTRSMKTLQDEVNELGSETVARSDEEATADDGDSGEMVQRSENASPFAGMFGNRFK